MRVTLTLCLVALSPSAGQLFVTATGDIYTRILGILPPLKSLRAATSTRTPSNWAFSFVQATTPFGEEKLSSRFGYAMANGSWIRTPSILDCHASAAARALHFNPVSLDLIVKRLPPNAQ